MRLAPLIEPELLQLLREEPGELPEVLEDIHPEDVAEIADHISDEDVVALLRAVPETYAAEVFARLDSDRQSKLAELLGADSAARIAVEMAADDRADFFSVLPAPVEGPLFEELERVDPEAAESVAELRRWPSDQAGGLMTTDFISVRAAMPLAEVVETLRRDTGLAEGVHSIYVVDSSGRLQGELSFRAMLLAAPSRLAHEEMLSNVVTVRPDLDQEEVARVLAKYDLMALPVTEANGELLGVITADDVLDVIAEEQAEDLQKMGGMEALDGPYLRVAFASMVKKRAGWLAALFLGEMLTATAMAYFQDEIARAVILALFVPLIISSGGNSGSQASTLVIRAMALDEVRIADWWRVVRREIVAGLVLGLVLGTIGFFRIVLWQAVTPTYGEHYLLVAATVFFSLIGVVTFGTFAGSLLPFILRRLGFDPASASTPFVATLVDVTGLVIYFSVAAVFMRGTLL